MAELMNISHPAAIDCALREIRAGNVIALPLESGYIFAVDAFNRDAVSELHLLRSDPPGQAASVMIGDKTRIVGIVREPSPAAEALMDNFWPGLLTLYLRPHAALTWDLGDERILDQIAVRVTQQLHFHVTRTTNQLLEIHFIIAKGGGCFAPRDFQLRGQLIFGFDHPHAPTAAAPAGLEH